MEIVTATLDISMYATGREVQRVENSKMAVSKEPIMRGCDTALTSSFERRTSPLGAMTIRFLIMGSK